MALQIPFSSKDLSAYFTFVLKMGMFVPFFVPISFFSYQQSQYYFGVALGWITLGWSALGIDRFNWFHFFKFPKWMHNRVGRKTNGKSALPCVYSCAVDYVNVSSCHAACSCMSKDVQRQKIIQFRWKCFLRIPNITKIISLKLIIILAHLIPVIMLRFSR